MDEKSEPRPPPPDAPEHGPRTPLDRVYDMSTRSGVPRWAQAVIGILSALIFVIVAANIDLGKTLDSWFGMQSKAQHAEEVQSEKALVVMAELLKRQQEMARDSGAAPGLSGIRERLDVLEERMKSAEEALVTNTDTATETEPPPP